MITCARSAQDQDNHYSKKWEVVDVLLNVRSHGQWHFLTDTFSQDSPPPELCGQSKPKMMGYNMYNVKENKITEDSDRANLGGVQGRIFDDYDYAVWFLSIWCKLEASRKK